VNLHIKRFIIAILSFLTIDGLWLYFMTSRFYDPALQGLLSANPRLAAAGIFYLFYAIGIVILIVNPALTHN